VATLSSASSTVVYSGRKLGTATRSSTLATSGRAPHSRKLVAGQSLEGWLATAENTAVHSGSMESTAVRSQTIP
jgi:hypothetical protein